MSLLTEKMINSTNNSAERTAGPLKIFDKMNNVRRQGGKSVCKIKTTEGDQGTGALYRVVDKCSKDRFLIMTCNHVLPTTSLKEIMQTILEFEEIPQMESIRLSKEHILFVWTVKLLGATVIEITTQVASLYSSYGAQFLKVGEAKLHAEVVLLQYPLGTISIMHGDIDKLEGTDVFYRMGTAPGSSGSPLVTWDCEAIAMHKAGIEAVSEDQPNKICKATSLIAIIDSYLEEISEIKQQTIALKDQLESLRAELDEKRKQTLKHHNDNDNDALRSANHELNANTTSPGAFDGGDIEGRRNVSLLQIISKEKLMRTPNENFKLTSLTAISDDAVFLACAHKGVRALSLSIGQLSEREPTAIKPVHSVAFDAATDTLLLAWVDFVQSHYVYWLVSLRRVADEWSEVQRVQISDPIRKWMKFRADGEVSLQVVFASRSLLGGNIIDDKLYAFDVSAEHRLLPVGTVISENRYKEFACTRAGRDTLVALALYDNAVSLHRLVELRLEQLASVQLFLPSRLSFLSDLLLVEHGNDGNDREQTACITSFAATGGRLTLKEQLLEAKGVSVLRPWCVAGERLVIFTYSDDLLLFALK